MLSLQEDGKRSFCFFVKRFTVVTKIYPSPFPRYVAGSFDCSSGQWQANFGDATNTTLVFTTSCDGHQNTDTTDYTSTRINTKANDDQCNVIYDKASVVGSWGNAQVQLEYFDICDGAEDDAEGSYEFSNGVEGYFWGKIHENQQIAQGNFSNINTRDSLRNAGLGLFFRRSTTEAVYLYWYGPSIDAEQFDEPNRHAVTTNIQYRDNTPNKCAYNRYVVIPVEYSDNASLLGVGLLLIAILVLF
jgi:hypothetical protein